MKNISLGFLTILLISEFSAVNSAQAQSFSNQHAVTFKTLLKELVNRKNLAIYPNGEWASHHASSYDRNYANHDWDNYVRVEDIHGEKVDVLLDVKGPGVLTRFWVGGYPDRKADLRFYIDGQSVPFWKADHTGALIGQNKVIGSPLSGRSIEDADAGDNLYAPIPFRHHIKITYQRPKKDSNDHFWYNIDYRIYQPNVSVKSFSTKTPQKYAHVLKKTNRELKQFMALSPEKAIVSGEKKIKSIPFDLKPGSSKSIELKGPASIKKLFLSLKADSMNSAVKNTWLQVFFDDKETINIPVGFLFGCGDQLVKAGNWFSKVDMNGDMASYWVMPYKHKAVIRLINQGNQEISGILKVATGNWKWTKNSMYFHASFNRMNHFMTQAQKGRDFTYLNIEGKAGVYVGDILQVNKAVGGWWGEGDPQIYIDNKSFPTLFGTGTEDYYGYSWGNPAIFNHAFYSQPIGNADLQKKGGTSVNSRVRSLDAIPFKHYFHFTMESWNWFGGPVNFAWSCFWYEKP